MNVYRLLLAAVLCIFAWVLGSAAQKQPDPRESLNTVIPEAIRLLESRDYVAFLKTYVAPDELKRIAQDKSVEQVAAEFGGERAARLLAVLKAAKDVEPTIYARFNLKEPVDGTSAVTLTRTGNQWLIQNQRN